MNSLKGNLSGSNEDFIKHGIDKNKTEVREDGQRLNNNDLKKGMYEWWYFDAHLDDGSLLVSAFMIQVNEKNELVPQITFNYADMNSRVDKIVECSPGDYSGSKDKCNVSIRKNYFRGNGLDEYEIFLDPAENDGWGFNVKLKRIAPSFRPGTGHWDAGEDFFAWFVAVPAGTIEGTITKAGKEYKIKGSGYHDHNWGNVPMSRILSDWYWGRAEIGGLSLVSANVRFKEEYGGKETPLIYLTKGDEVILNAYNEELSFLSGFSVQHPETGKKYNSDVIYVYEKEKIKAYIRLNGADKIVAYTNFNWDNPGWETKYLRFAADTCLDLDINGSRSVSKGIATLEIMDFFGKKI